VRIIPFEIEVERGTFLLSVLHLDWPEGDASLLQIGWWCGRWYFDIFWWWGIRYAVDRWRRTGALR
jgi:hypothetical protein